MRVDVGPGKIRRHWKLKSENCKMKIVTKLDHAFAPAPTAFLAFPLVVTIDWAIMLQS
jgi:hypothetical protein